MCVWAHVCLCCSVCLSIFIYCIYVDICAQDCAKFDWTSYQFSAATSAAYQSIYNNTNGILTLILDVEHAHLCRVVD